MDENPRIPDRLRINFGSGPNSFDGDTIREAGMKLQAQLDWFAEQGIHPADGSQLLACTEALERIAAT